MESQESDICNPEDMELILNDVGGAVGVEDILNADWSAVHVPENNPTGELPSRTAWPGEYLFDAKVDTSGMHKKHYVTSTKLNKLYVDMGKVVPFQILWDGHPDLYLRALMMFTPADHLKVPVKRCIMHREPKNSDLDPYDHVLTTSNDNARYFLDESSQRHSVLVPLHLQSGSNYAIINYKFNCKTSCTGGLNRTPTDVILTLEDAGGLVLGRQIVGVKICACPKRDKEKDEANLADPPGKRKLKIKKEDKKSVEPPAKKIKQEFEEQPHGSSFMVNCISPEVAALAKEHLQQWANVKAVEWAQASAGVPNPPSLLNIEENIAVLQQPFL